MTEKSESLLRINQAAEYLGISVSSLYRLTSRREIPYVKIGSRVIFQPEKLREWVNAHTVKPEGG